MLWAQSATWEYIRAGVRNKEIDKNCTSEDTGRHYCPYLALVRLVTAIPSTKSPWVNLHVVGMLLFWHKPTELAHFFIFCSCIYFCLHSPFNCISFHEFSWRPSVFSFCSFGLISALLVFSTIYLFVSLLQPWYNPLWLTGLKAPTN